MPLERDLEGRPGEWSFDGSVSDAFDEMLARSIPDLGRMRALCYDVGREFARAGTAIIDLGSSRGDALAPFVSSPALSGSTFYAFETSEPMLDALRERFSGQESVRVVSRDLRDGLPLDELRSHETSLALAILTLQFVPVDHRWRLLDEVRDALAAGGALLVVEKTLPGSSRVERVFRERYWMEKRRQGYDDEEIVRKAAALEGVLVPMPARWTEDALERAGFVVEPFWRWLQFSGWLAVKP